MNKLAKYLNQHLMGEVLTDGATLDYFSINNGALTVKPEMVVFPRSTSDIRKLLRFTWQLAEKGHSLPVVSRGSGQNTTDAALSSGVVVALENHLNTVFEYDAKQLFVRLQPGVTVNALNNALRLQGAVINGLGSGSETVGGSIANGNTLQIIDAVEQLEVVLANGDVLQTRKVSKRDLNKIKGQQGFEADIYRDLDGLLEDNAELIDQLDEADASGYSAIRSIKAKDGSIDLAPLFVGSQGTLGIISEMILKADYMSDEAAVVTVSFTEAVDARDALDVLKKHGYLGVEYFDGALIRRAEQTGKDYKFDTDMAAVLVVTIDDPSARVRVKKAKRLQKLFKDTAAVRSSLDDDDVLSVRSVRTMADHINEHGASVATIDDAYIPLDRFEDFRASLQELSVQLSVDAPLYGRPMDELWSVRPMISLSSISGKQMLLKFMDKYAKLVAAHGGHLAGGHGEGRVQAGFVATEENVAELYKKIRDIFDPQRTLNPDAKQSLELRELAKKMRTAQLYRAPIS